MIVSKPIRVLLFVTFLAQTVYVCAGNIDFNNHVLCIKSEKQALLRFKQDLEDPHGRLSSWVAEQEDCCKWAGIVCDNITGHVKELRLANPFDIKNEPLRGKVSPSLLALKHLYHLDLSYNDFMGIQIPTFLSSLVSLRYLNLSKGQFQGEIPHQLGNLTSLRYLDIQCSDDQLYAKNLDWLTGLSSLRYLDLSVVDISEASDSLFIAINTLPSLLELHLAFCEISHIPPLSYLNFTSLRVLDLAYNSITSLPNWFYALKNLMYLDLGRNTLGGSTFCRFQNMSLLKYLDLTRISYERSTIPSCIYNFPDLEHLFIASNKFQGSISSGIDNLTSLVSLDLSYNALEGKLPEALGNLCSLEEIDLGANKYSGKISEAFESLSVACLSNRLKSLTLAHNFFPGQLVTNQIGKFKNLVHLSLRNNTISGQIPESIGKLSALQSLNLAENHFNGSLPKSLGSLSNLKELYIFGNHLEGVVTEFHFINLTNLRELYASENSLVLRVSPNWIPPFHLDELRLDSWIVGPQFPMWLKGQNNLILIDLSNTSIAEKIPNWFWNLSSQLEYIDLSYNQIHGEVPDLLPLSLSLSAIYLGSNKLSGPLPRISYGLRMLSLSNNSFFGDIDSLLCHPVAVGPNSLRFLSLRDNLLAGKIPDCWKYWQSLMAIDLGNNNLIGEISNSIGSLKQLESLHLRNNSLSGEIPLSLQNCTYLRTLDLGLNKLTGGVPTWIGSLENLQFLVISSNKLHGHIPMELCNLTWLQILDISGNNISGIIPRCFNNFSTMVTKPQSAPPPVIYINVGGLLSLENEVMVSKGRENKYSTILALVTALDLSSNNLSGDIPEQLTTLQGLYSLNLSCNNIKGSIPDEIGNMTSLESFDVSRNQLSAKIPPSISKLTFLSYLNVSYNNLSGEIPLSTQLQSFDASSFIGNELCGPPLIKNCTTSHNSTQEGTENGEEELDNEEEQWFRLGIGMGFAVSFLGVIAPLVIYRTWRRAYFYFWEEYMWFKIVGCYIDFKNKLHL